MVGMDVWEAPATGAMNPQRIEPAVSTIFVTASEGAVEAKRNDPCAPQEGARDHSNERKRTNGVFLVEFEAEYPLMWDGAIEDKAEAFFRSDFRESSILFSGLDEEFNHRFFEGLQPYRVKVMRNAPIPDCPDEEPLSPEIDFNRKEVRI
jgi:hypothetical protein